MGKQNTLRYGAQIERGVIRSIEAGGCIVESIDRPGIVSPVIGDAAGRQAGEQVYFYLFDDGTGRILDPAKLSGRIVTEDGLTLNWRLLPGSGLMEIRLTGTPTADLDIGSAYRDVATVPELASSIGKLKYIEYGAKYRGQLSVTAAGVVRLGYTRLIEDNSVSGIPAGQNLYINEVFMI